MKNSDISVLTLDYNSNLINTYDLNILTNKSRKNSIIKDFNVIKSFFDGEINLITHINDNCG